jgi:hypothetical protein
MVIADESEVDSAIDVDGDTVNLSEKFYRASDMRDTDAALDFSRIEMMKSLFLAYKTHLICSR